MGPWLPELGPDKFRERSSGASIMQENLLITAFFEKNKHTNVKAFVRALTDMVAYYNHLTASFPGLPR